MTLVAIQDSDGDSVAVRQGLVAFQTVIDVVNSLPESLGIDQGVNPSDGIGAAYRLPEPTAKEAGVGDLPIRAQNKAATDLMTLEVEMRGCGRRSTMLAMTCSERPKIFSE